MFDISKSSRVNVPDHSLLSCSTHSSLYEQFRPPALDSRTRRSDVITPTETQGSTHRRYEVRILPGAIFQSEQCRMCLISVITVLESNIVKQGDIGTAYQQFLDTLHEEMDSELTFKEYTPGMRSHRKHSKPYWNDELKELWVKARDAEKKYLKWRGDNARRNDLQHNFQYLRKQFDKEIRCVERVYNAQQRDHIQQISTEDPNRFWDAIKKLGPGNTSDMRIDKVKLDGRSISSDPEQIKNKWKHDFETLYQRSNIPDNATENDFLAYDAAIAGKGPRRDDLEEDVYLASLQLNSAITLQETINAPKQCKNGKATGIDNAPNEVLKIPAQQEILFKLFHTWFETNKIPSMWYKGIIQPIPKRGKTFYFYLTTGELAWCLPWPKYTAPL